MSQQMTFDFRGCGVVITGAAQGIGLQMARDFLQAGAQVALWDRSEGGLKSATAELNDFSPAIQTQVVDIANRQNCDNAAKKLSFRPRILINNAGITRDKTFRKMTCEDYEAVIEVNLVGAMHVTHALLPYFDESCVSNRIINISSVVGRYGNFGQTNYAAAKAGLIGFTQSLAKELGRKGFTVNAVAPGYVATSMVDAIPEDVRQRVAAMTPVGRLGQPEEISAACQFLASERAGYINGSVLAVDGGLVT